MSLLSRIKKLCINRDTSLAGLERNLGFSNGSIIKWDKNSPSVEKLKKVADYFHVSTDYLLEKTDNPIPSINFKKNENQEIEYILAKVKIELENNEKLTLEGESVRKDAIESILGALEYGMNQAKKMNKK